MSTSLSGTLMARVSTVSYGHSGGSVPGGVRRRSADSGRGRISRRWPGTRAGTGGGGRRGRCRRSGWRLSCAAVPSRALPAPGGGVLQLEEIEPEGAVRGALAADVGEQHDEGDVVPEVGEVGPVAVREGGGEGLECPHGVEALPGTGTVGWRRRMWARTCTKRRWQMGHLGQEVSGTSRWRTAK